MKASELFVIIKNDLDKLSTYRSQIEQKIQADNDNSINAVMARYNYYNLIEILNTNNIHLDFEVDDDKLKDFQRRIDHYLSIYAPNDADLKRYITGISMYLAFIAKKPLHPPGLTFDGGAEVCKKDGLLYCSGKRTFIKDELSLCKFCVCKPL